MRGCCALSFSLLRTLQQQLWLLLPFRPHQQPSCCRFSSLRGFLPMQPPPSDGILSLLFPTGMAAISQIPLCHRHSSGSPVGLLRQKCPFLSPQVPFLD